ncbi:hypothetical protein ACHQM5_005783 [Ranunculus cassubicifolius]
MAAKQTYFGLNLGTKNTYLSVLDKGSNTPKLLKKFPSEVVVTNQVDKNDINPKDYLPGFLRLIGRNFDDPIVQKDKEKAPYKIIKGPNGYAWYETSYGRHLSPTQLLEMFILKIKGFAESYLGEGSSVSGIIYTFPSRLPSVQFEAISHAVSKVWCVDESSFVHEFAAAAAFYGLITRRGLYAIVDLGARTLDIVLFKVSFGVCRSFSLKRLPMRDMFLGGDDFDDAIVKYLVSEFKSLEGIDLVEDVLVLLKIQKAAEEAKIALSTTLETEINMPNIITDSSGVAKDLKITLTRAKFQSLVTDLIEKIKKHCESVMNEASITSRNVDEVVLVGGMANVPMVRRVVAEVFAKAPHRGVNPEEAVVLGTACSVEASCLGVNSSCLDAYTWDRSANSKHPFSFFSYITLIFFYVNCNIFMSMVECVLFFNSESRKILMIMVVSQLDH